MSKCRRCVNCVICDIARFYSFNILKVSLLRIFLKALLWKEQEIAKFRKYYDDYGWLFFYPSRHKIVFYVLHYKVIMWLSVDETGNRAV